MTRYGRAIAVVLCLWAATHGTAARGAEIYSNATGGGPWSDPATWKGGATPGPDDDVVLARDDTVTFDRNDDGRVTCHLLSLDPRSLLQFKTGAGTVVFSAGGLVDSYGTIRLDATRFARDRHEFRLVAADPEQRMLRVAKGGGLVVAGRAGLPKGAHNAMLSALPPPVEPPVDPSGIVEVTSGTLDVQRAEITNVYLQALTIDNTGAKPGERVNLVRNRFSGTSRIMLSVCDTALLADNLFERDAQPPLQQPAIYLTGCPLAELRGNTVRGTYAGGITGYGQSDTSVTKTLIEKCPAGMYWYGSNFMIRDLTIRECGHGMTLTSAAGALEDVTIEGCNTGYHHGGATVQFTNLVIRNMQANSPYDIYFASGPLTLLNCNIRPEQIKWDPGFPPKPDPTQPASDKPRPPAVQALQFLVVELKGEAPPGAKIDVRTAAPAVPLPEGAADPNVRNSPAPVSSSRLTPLPKTLEPLIVRSWMFDADAKQVAAPEYQLRVLAPAAGGGEPQALKTIALTPQDTWFRPEPNEKKATVEVTLP